jgi:hypothetical protein
MKEDSTNLDDSLDQDIEEINENMYLTAYFHCDKGSGNIVEDITDNNVEGVINYNCIQEAGDDGSKNDDLIWSHVLEEFEPLEYEDKWGRKSPGSHAIRFSSMLYLI